MLVADARTVKELVGWRDDWCVSAFLPVHEVAGRRGGDSLRLKNLLREAERELLELGVRRADAQGLLERAVPDEIADRDAAAFHRAGVAMFVAPGIASNIQLTRATPELMTVARRFHLRPLLAELANHRRFFVLAITRGSAKLHAGGPDRLRPVDVPAMPASLDDAIQYDERERTVQSHSASRRGVGGVVAAYHGQGDRDDHLPEDMLRYLRMVDASLDGVIGAATPLVLAGSRDTVAAYRNLSSRSTLAEDAIFGNPDVMPASELHARALEIVAAAPSGAAEDAAHFAALHGTGRASNVPATVFAAARRGQVATLFAAADVQQWGRFAPATPEPEVHETRAAGDEDLIDTAAVDAWTTGATVRVLPAAEVPGGSPVAAVFRY